VLLALGLLASVVGASVSWLVAHAQSVGAGQSHSAVLKTGGTIASWGYNGYGQIGDGTNTQRNVPVELNGHGHRVTQVQVGAAPIEMHET
jgi:alpha-tubulin suppressor-like RCC1 family protein